VDEGHKGSGGEAWRKYRDALGATGFTFEYSATFGQALSAARNDPLTAEYGKAIIFDYSYRYFYGDGFGKDFRILNLKKETQADKTDTLLLGNLLSFYEQLRLYEEQADALRPYNLEKPLWVFVGSTVNAVYTENKQPRSDVFIEPHGMLHAKAYIHDEKARLHERLPALAQEIEKRSGRQDIALDSYIISATPFDDLRRRYDDGKWDMEKFAQKHILFRERNEVYDYIKKLVGG